VTHPGEEEAAARARAIVALRCPACAAGLSVDVAGFVCGQGHRFDRAKQGYVHLSATPIRHGGDTVAMVEARERVLATGAFDPLSAALASAVPEPTGEALLVDVGAGTGHHLARVLEAHPDAAGLAVDTSKPALRRAGRAHPRVLAIAADVTGPMPLQDGSADAVLVVFAPRPAAELARIVRTGGTLVVATPTPAHLAEIAGPLGMLDVPADKGRDVAEALADAFDMSGEQKIRHQVPVDRVLAVDLALMGPLGFHIGRDELAGRAASLAEVTEVTVAVDVLTFIRG
jgi:23S rRNA (guanine745-N1)-methyltransferase